MPQSYNPTVDELSKGFSNLSANTQHPTSPAPFSSTFQSTFQSPGFTSAFSNNFSINLGPPKFSSINLPNAGVNVPHVSSKFRPATVNMDAAGGTAPTEPTQNTDVDNERVRERRTKFRFKSKKASRSASPDRESRNHRHHRSSRRDHDGREEGEDDEHTRSRAGSRHRSERSHRRPRHKRPRREEAAAPPPGFADEGPILDPDAAFRESLFDAMADDEGAAYWEGIYGQPIHIYSQEVPNQETGELERMTDEEYAAHVRQRMWEKTHAGLMEERARRAKKREEHARRGKEAEARMEEERRIQREVERSLKRGEERRRRREWTERFREYGTNWDGWDGDVGSIPWPTKSGRRQDVDEEEVRAFFVRGLDLETLGEREFAAKLKEQRVRWHPDKIQQKLGGREKADERVMKDVTVVFQVIDTLYDDIRAKSK
ncbi:hypothetical protein J7T55_009272 [Diaporthe amygdali]|uniref:uncharacterized protein n=1 Tax=Phomopsis amygdali TaxID=1214568 RepID=UPI0022FED749|nr:uncharacterized protein J7T55_009272 [Diaporthe amygdali]KAJ0118489.1 hypothetical protein J7T55_009272 [Diaporthe amygdali]